MLSKQQRGPNFHILEQNNPRNKNIAYFRKQNREYCEYLLKVLYHESNKVEDWEVELRQEKDCEIFELDKNSKDIESKESQNHMQSLNILLNQGENQVSLTQYKNAVTNLLGLRNELPVIPENA